MTIDEGRRKAADLGRQFTQGSSGHAEGSATGVWLRAALGAKVLRGFRSAGVLEVVEKFVTDTYRAVYTVRFSRAVFVLHCLKKKSARGIETPRPDRELIFKRLDDARRLLEGN